MTREELVGKVAAAAGISKAKANEVLGATLDAIVEALGKGDKVTLVGFGTFQVATRKARTGRNPRTGERINIPATKVPKFRPGKRLVEAVRK
ncbi:MAG: DNA-binding protein HU [Candidatus Latescibacterota bacterium]|nr:MAG: DNA-binding protein HU [Candidatus Latescibacterota bacterium]RKY64511.1 MAG: DNA-binding protein HU [Candidatus Latescibacterota bacterium]RKY74065.1 MAG: DNA-binding protein HU [Candidatus Latescibacterota bacterium]HDH99990.1 HU family DNA-binding protein [Bacillota bacterium]